MAAHKIILAILAVAVVTAGFVVGRMSGNPIAVPDSVRDRIGETVSRVFPAIPPLPPDESAPAAVEQPDVVLETPAENEAVGKDFSVTGRFRDDGRTLRITVRDSDGRELDSSLAEPVRPSDQEFVRFSAAIGPLSTGSGRLVVEAYSIAADGAVSGPEAVRVVRVMPPDSFEVSVYFPNSILDPEISCIRTFPVARDVESHGQPYREAILALLAGPTAQEKKDGYLTVIPSGTGLNFLTVGDDGQALVDFGRRLNDGVAGSCMVGSIRSQIESTLLQFPEIKRIVISVDGRSEDILQP